MSRTTHGHSKKISKVWYPGIDRIVGTLISSCLPCQACTRETIRELLMMTPLPKGPWLTVSADQDICLRFPTSEYVLVVLDAGIPVIQKSNCKKTRIHAATITSALERIFVTHGIPEVVKTDNGAPF